jgi:hypothetical protein
MTVPYIQISGDAKRALEVFDTQFDGALAAMAAEPWARTYGLYNSSRNIKTTYPVPVSAAGYVEEKGDDELRSLYERSLSMKSKTWVDGFAEKARVVEAPDFIGWGTEPQRIALEGMRQPNKLVALLLQANPLLGFYADEQLGLASTIALFATNHPHNVFDSSLGTFQNFATATAIDAAMMEAASIAAAARKAPNGEQMSVDWTHLLVPRALKEQAKNFFESDLMRAAILEGGVGSQKNTQLTTNNRWKGTTQLVYCDELRDADMIYFVDANHPAKPWILQDGGEIERMTLDKSSALYERTGKVGMKFKLELNAAACLPHAIQRVQITG